MRVPLELPPAPRYQVTLEATAFAAPRRVRLAVEGVPLGAFTVTPDGYRQYSVELPGALLPEDGPLWLTVEAGIPESPATRGLSADDRPLSIALNGLRLSTP
ncbi:MAG: hypothetical protein HC915_13520 [Anaerolineae bacterium]|nr:hypothetical protein [Anaerolineae bacterium]